MTDFASITADFTTPHFSVDLPAVFYRLLSKKFRVFIAGLKGQNINNLDIDKVDVFGLTVPQNLKEFVEDALDRERKLDEINEALAKIK